MKLRYTLIITAVVLAGCSSPEIAEQKPASDFTPQPTEFESDVTIKSPVIMKGIYGSRSQRSREEWEKRWYYTSESAVMRSLRWFKKEQNKDGSWNTWKDPKALATGIALLPFLAHGETPASEEFGKTFEKAVLYLLSIQNDDGRFKGATKNPAIEHGIITYALCETYALTKVPKIKDAAAKAVNIILESQLPSGLWSSEYATNSVQDMETSTWQIMALKAARMAGFKDDRLIPALKNTTESLKEYISNNKETPITAPAIVCLQFIRYSNDPICKEGVKAFDGVTMNWEEPEFDNPVYHWHFITQAKFSHVGQAWGEWNNSVAPTLPKVQTIIKNGITDMRGREVDIGYWVSPSRHERYGKIYSTALCCLMQANYYIYSRRFKPLPVDEKDIKTEEGIEIEIEI